MLIKQVDCQGIEDYAEDAATKTTMNLKRYLLSLTLLASSLLLPFAAVSGTIDILQGSLFLSTSGSVYQDDQLGVYAPTPGAPLQVNNFGASGLNVEFLNNLNPNPVPVGPFSGGSYSWRITNNTGGTISDAHLMGYLDAEVPDFFTNYGETLGDLSPYDSWEIDDPDPFYGDILQNASVVGSFDNSNLFDDPNDPNDEPKDSPEVGFAYVALGLGFEVGDWMQGETILATFLLTDIAGQDNPAGNGLVLRDLENANHAFLYSASVTNIGVIPIPGTGGLMLTGLASLLVARYRLNKRVRS